MKFKKLENLKVKLLEEKYDEELFNACITLKNLAIVQSDKPFSADFVYEQLLINSKLLKPFLGEMITLYRKGDDVEAFKVLTQKINTKQAKNFSLILSKLDKINPSELVEQVLVFQEAMSDLRMTTQLKKADRNSIITTLFSTATIFALLLNFAVVVVFMDTINTLQRMFV
ncbi:MAG: hypothetical protein RR495_03815 [Anaerovoracaceae bacterium]